MGFMDDDFIDLPLGEPDDSRFEVDKNVNVETIDDYLGIPGVAYRDMRFLDDTARWGDIGGDPKLTFTIEGFQIVPWPYIGTLGDIPVPGGYKGSSLFEVTWEKGEKRAFIAEAKPNYAESLQIVEELFPRDEPIVMVCGGGGYSGMMRWLLGYLGWDLSQVYNIGAGWHYKGDHKLHLIEEDEAGVKHQRMWRAHYTDINFNQLTPLE